MISDSLDLPYNKSLMYESLDHTRDFLQLRSEDWYEANNINYQLGHHITSINNQHGQPYVLMDDSIKVEYDAVLLATGAEEFIRDDLGMLN